MMWFDFNITTFNECVEHINILEMMKERALIFAKEMNYSENVGLFVHPFGFNSVNSFHLHILDMDHLGEYTYDFHKHKNLSLDDAIEGFEWFERHIN